MTVPKVDVDFVINRGGLSLSDYKDMREPDRLSLINNIQIEEAHNDLSANIFVALILFNGVRRQVNYSIYDADGSPCRMIKDLIETHDTNNPRYRDESEEKLRIGEHHIRYEVVGTNIKKVATVSHKLFVEMIDQYELSRNDTWTITKKLMMKLMGFDFSYYSKTLSNIEKSYLFLSFFSA